jgi:hypothetical protein
MQFTKPPPLAAALYLSQTVDALQLAHDALGEAFAAQVEIKLEDQGPIDSLDVLGFKSICNLFLQLFAPARAQLGLRDVHLGVRVRECIQSQTGTPDNPPGLERAGLALGFAVATLADALDALDGVDDGDDWRSLCLAGRDMFSMIEAAIECGTVRGGVNELFDNGFCFFGPN